MSHHADLGEFLRSCRSRLRPDDIGLNVYGRQRRVPGLRREEIAQLAGVSVDYYIRLEQGRGRNVSEGVLDALARALQLDDSERIHLWNLARPVGAQRRRPCAQRVRTELRQMLDAMFNTPALVLGRRMDVIAWNRLARALMVDFDALPDDQRNMLRLVFLDENTKRLYPDWEQVAQDTVGYLRLDLARYPDDPNLATLVGELSVKSEPFRRLWADYSVRDKMHGQKRFDHPLVGPLTLSYETLKLADDCDQSLVIYTAEPGSSSEEALRLLGSWGTESLTESAAEAQ